MEPVLGVPVVGDFSFVKNSLLRESLTYDFKEINKIGEDAWEAFRNHDQDESFMYNTNGVYGTPLLIICTLVILVHRMEFQCGVLRKLLNMDGQTL